MYIQYIEEEAGARAGAGAGEGGREIFFCSALCAVCSMLYARCFIFIVMIIGKKDVEFSFFSLFILAAAHHLQRSTSNAQIVQIV